jgi:hypothetical protein
MIVMNTIEMTLERSLGKNFFPHSIKECEEDYIGENNWTENEGEYDSDLETNRDLVNSLHPYRNYPKKEGDRWKNGEPDSEHIELMTKKFLEDGGRITVLPTTESKRIMKEVGYKNKKKNSNKRPLNWSEELDLQKHWGMEHYLCPYNTYRIKVDKDWEESNHLCENREFWTEKMIPLMKEEDSDWESDFELEDRLDDMNEIASRYSTSYQMNQ